MTFQRTPQSYQQQRETKGLTPRVKRMRRTRGS
uniref:Uncharacterized protein n=1 Tax=Anguilla anguilla TaxID=7936 RepID=A0A0E9VBI5_ANGAN